MAKTAKKNKGEDNIQAIINRHAIPEHTVLPAAKDGENLVRTYPGASDVIGWTVFIRDARSYRHAGDPVYQTEREALAHLKEWRGLTIRLNWNPSAPRGL